MVWWLLGKRERENANNVTLKKSISFFVVKTNFILFEKDVFKLLLLENTIINFIVYNKKFKIFLIFQKNYKCKNN